jgi:hypothetical protein
MPLMSLACVRMIYFGDRSPGHRTARAMLAALCVVNLAGSFGLLYYVHTTQVLHSQYGPTWGSQQPGFVMPPPRWPAP